jgi:dUTP pyrophosphatase
MKKKLEEYLDLLVDFEEKLGDVDNVDDKLFREINNIMKLVDDEININQNPNINNMLNVKVKKLKENAVIPTYSNDGDAGMDLTVTEIINDNFDSITYGFGLAFEIPDGYVGYVFPRSSIRKYGLLLTNSVGVIDSTYRGEVQGTFRKLGVINEMYQIGERAAQIIIMPYPKIFMVESDELSETVRGTGGFGSTGF